MPRVNALSIFESENTQAKLNEIQAGIVENIQKKGISFRLKCVITGILLDFYQLIMYNESDGPKWIIAVKFFVCR